MNDKSNLHIPPAETEQTELPHSFLNGLAPINPSSSRRDTLHTQLMQRISQSVARQAGIRTVRLKDGVWQTLKTGIRFKQLWQGFEGNSVLIEFAPGATLSAHRHQWLEEGIVLRGRLQMGTLDLGPSDYHRSAIGSRHQPIQSKQGALAYLRGTSLGDTPAVLKELLGGLLPFKGLPSHTVFASQAHTWQLVDTGIEKLTLCRHNNRASQFYRFQPGAKRTPDVYSQDEECMVIHGEVFLGDRLLKAGDYQLATAGSQHHEILSDEGCLLFVRGAGE